MEEKDINSMASAISNALAKLNADEARANRDIATQDDKSGSVANASVPNEVFSCPECDAPVKGGIAFCQACGCPLEWEN
jgi:membrane protease subunit (stomatin/prohibitin family)